MATDYILFVHGVNTRDRREDPHYADQLFQRLQKNASNHKRNLKKIALYWGDVNKDAEDSLLKQLQESSLWKDMWFRTFREQQLLQFAGDAALYISRQVGSQVVQELKKQTLIGLDGSKNAQSDDRLHLVTHSWGTVILFDILFAGRWDDPNVPGHDDVMAIRDQIYGLSGKDANPYQGVQIESIHTMGSPVAIFSLMNLTSTLNTPSSHNITPQMQKLLESLHARRNGLKLPWRNYIHPGDPIAYPLEKVITNIVDNDNKYLDLKDHSTHELELPGFLTDQPLLALLHGGEAHGSYFTSDKVVQDISEVLNNY